MMLMIMMLFSVLIISTKHPLTMGMILLIQTINLSLYMGYLNLNYWYSYILFLIMIGGMLVLFIYMTSIASNEKFSPSIKLFLTSNSILMLYFFMYFIDPFYMNLNNNYKEYVHNLSLNKYFNFPNSIIMYMLIIYLLITLFAVVKITSFKKGSLRMTNY
uniref:NADH-ubiquinone oxidoreductase chain 6 n=1 Tax=Onthophagus cf. jeannelianus TaxID=1848579 RepID=A0A1X9HDW7_9SCAR|nr:NADH deshydrogenase subunit 6 [Onthophagus cf. jeannelianus]